jgi:hypothetical protein
LTCIVSCSRPTETNISQATDSSGNNEIETKDNLPDFVVRTPILNNLMIDRDKIINGDFNGDQIDDFASIVKNLDNGFKGVLIVHDNDNKEYFLFGAGNEINGMTNLDWIDIFNKIPKGEIIAPTLVDSETGDIIGPDESKEFRLIGDGIYMHVDEACGGGILYWTGKNYEWCHIE